MSSIATAEGIVRLGRLRGSGAGVAAYLLFSESKASRRLWQVVALRGGYGASSRCRAPPIRVRSEKAVKAPPSTMPPSEAAQGIEVRAGRDAVKPSIVGCTSHGGGIFVMVGVPETPYVRHSETHLRVDTTPSIPWSAAFRGPNTFLRAFERAEVVAQEVYRVTSITHFMHR